MKHHQSVVTPANNPISVRAIATGVALGGLLCICNLYMGLRIGFSINMSILATLLCFAFWQFPTRLGWCRPWDPKECNVQQTAASAAGGTVSAGLISAIPAYFIFSGEQIAFIPLLAWLIAISILGISVATALRPAMLADVRLRFPTGMATAGMIQDLFANGRHAQKKIHAMLLGMVVAFGHRLVFPPFMSISLGFSIPGFGKFSGSSISAKNLGFVIEPSYMLLALGALIELRTAISLLVGAVIAWLGVGPLLVGQGWLAPGPAEEAWFPYLIGWLVWPGLALMLGTSLTSLALRMWRSEHRFQLHWGSLEFYILAAVTPVIVFLQVWYFDVAPLAALLSVPLAFIFAVMASQVVGVTGIPPIGALGKLSQLSFAAIAPGQTGTNLIAGNVASGSAGQATDLLNDFRAGAILGTNPRHQMLAQACGILVGCVVSLSLFMLLIPDPAKQLVTTEWPAPGVAMWNAIARALTMGLDTIPGHAAHAVVIGIVMGVIAEIVEFKCPKAMLPYLPSFSAVGLAFVLPANVSLMIAIGAILAATMRKLFPKWTQRFLIVFAAGCIAGESIAGVLGTLISLVGMGPKAI